jgi:hypothetical protein
VTFICPSCKQKGEKYHHRSVCRPCALELAKKRNEEWRARNRPKLKTEKGKSFDVELSSKFLMMKL